MCDVWHHSVYWRLTIGIIGFLGLALAIQGALLLWLADANVSLLATTWGITVLLGAGAVVAWAFSSGSRRLWHLREVSVRIDAGDLEARAPEQGVDEVAVVAKSYNRLADDLAARNREREASDRTRRQLLADVSHELITPLTAIRGYVETLETPKLDLDSAERGRYLRNLDAETQRLETVVMDLRDLARIEAGGATLHPDTVSVDAVFDRISTRHEHELAARHITLTRSIGERAESLVADPNRIEQALQNLASNALNFTPDGGAIHLEASLDGDAIRLVVRDTGPGVPTAHLPYVFDRFYKVDKARHQRGSGLGLSIVKAIVGSHGGTVTAANHPEGGAVFELTIPQPPARGAARGLRA